MGKILVLGDSILDVYISGISTRRSPEADAPVIQTKSIEYRLGGAANVYANCISLGGEGDFVTVVGEDPYGEKISELLLSVGPHCIYTRPEPTTVKTRIFSNGRYIARLDSGDDSPKFDSDILVNACGNRNPDILVLSDYNKGLFSRRLFRNLLSGGKDRFVIVDGKNPDIECYHGASLITPNLNESLILTGKADPDEAALVLLEYVENVLITKSEHGMTLYHQNRKVDFPALCKDVVSFIGAGDQIVAGVAVALSEGLDLISALQFANQVVGVGLHKSFTPVVYRHEICTQS